MHRSPSTYLPSGPPPPLPPPPVTAAQPMHSPTTAVMGAAAEHHFHNDHCVLAAAAADALPSKNCCGVHVTQTVSIRWFIVMIAFVGICCSIVGTALGALKASGREHLTVSLLMIGKFDSGSTMLNSAVSAVVPLFLESRDATAVKNPHFNPKKWTARLSGNNAY